MNLVSTLRRSPTRSRHDFVKLRYLGQHMLNFPLNHDPFIGMDRLASSVFDALDLSPASEVPNFVLSEHLTGPDSGE